MKVLYFIIGLLAGVTLTVKHADIVIGAVDHQWQEVLSAMTLATYHEGIVMGQAQAEARLRQNIIACYIELIAARKAHMTQDSNDWSYKEAR